MTLDQKMMISLLTATKVLNVRFREPDITNEIRAALRPVMKDFDEECLAYIRLLREPDTICTTVELMALRAITKNIKTTPANELVAQVTALFDFISERILDRLRPVDDPLPAPSSDTDFDETEPESESDVLESESDVLESEPENRTDTPAEGVPGNASDVDVDDEMDSDDSVISD